MAQAPRKLQKYQIDVEGGGTYEVQAYDDAQAEHLGSFIKEQVAAGNPQLQNVELPFNAQTQQRELPQTTAGGAATRGLVRGGTLNFGDEIGAFGNAAGLAAVDNLTGAAGSNDQQAFWNNPDGFWAAFDHNLGKTRDAYAADDAQHPVAAGTGEVVGGVTAALRGGPLLARGIGAVAPRALQTAAIPAVARLEAATLGAPVRTAIARGVAEGGAFGYASGFGGGDTLDNRVKGGGTGAIAGGMLGGGAGALIAGLGPTVARYANVLLGRGNDREAVRQIVQKLGQDGFDVTTPTGVQALRTELAAFTTKPVSLADVGSATRARTGVGLRSPSGAQQQSIDQLMARSQGQGARLATDIRANVAPRTDVHALDDALVEQRAAEALPLREQALYQREVTPPELPPMPAPTPAEPADAGLMRMLGETAPPISGGPQALDRGFIEAMQSRGGPSGPVAGPVQPFGPPAPTIVERAPRMVTDPTLTQLTTEHPLAQRALGGAVGLSQSERALKQMLGQNLDDVPEMLAGQPLDYRTTDYLKRFLDDQVNRLYKRGDTETFKAAEATQVKALRDAIRERMRGTNEEYGQYLDSYRGSSEMIDALGDGRTYRQLDPEQISAGQAGRSTAAQELYRVGAARDMMDTLNATGDTRNAAGRILNSPESRAQLEATGVTPEGMANLTRSVGQERQLNLLPAELAGSQTAQRGAAQVDADAGVSAQLPFNPGSPFGWLGAGARAVLNRASSARNAAVNEALLPRLLETDPAAVSRIIGELETGGQQEQATLLRRALNAKRTGRSLGAVIGGPVSIQEGN